MLCFFHTSVSLVSLILNYCIVFLILDDNENFLKFEQVNLIFSVEYICGLLYPYLSV